MKKFRFIHNNKTGGTAIIHALQGVCPNYANICDLAPPDGRLFNDADWVFGHWALHSGREDIDALPTFMMFRNPISRLRSNIFHWMDRIAKEDGTVGIGELWNCMSVQRVEFNNLQARYLIEPLHINATPSVYDALGPNLKIAAIKDAIENRIQVVGIFEEFDTSVEMMRKAFDIPQVTVTRENAGSDRWRLPEGIDQWITKMTRWDWFAYDLAKEKFERQKNGSI